MTQNALPIENRPITAPAGFFGTPFSDLNPSGDLEESFSILREIRSSIPDLASWINVPLVNQSGADDDLSLAADGGPGRITEYGRRLPRVTRAVNWLTAEGFVVQNARLAILLERDVLRPHVDMHSSIRLLVPLNEQGDDFRHVFGEQCVAMRPGELWGIEPTICHGAANVARSGQRVMLLIDASEKGPTPSWYKAAWMIPDSSHVARSAWTAGAREEFLSNMARQIGRVPIGDVEREWLLLPFEYELSPECMYEELIAFCESASGVSSAESEAREWRARAEYWVRHKCICVAESKTS
jgi:Aspartyl/Asparaginyl beta-hydroxylase